MPPDWNLDCDWGLEIGLLSNHLSSEQRETLTTKKNWTDGQDAIGLLSAWPLLSHSVSRGTSAAGVVVAKVQHLALGLFEPHTVGFGPSIQPVQVPLHSNPAFQQIDTPPRLGVICKFANGALNPLIQIINKDIEQDWVQH
ncbi:hypothetical protein WISP_134969 [Willisornis vidua]|uniref:Uncharacterized protein n=1 Tax=Willisornis vidua TaxID=1566151 RepID=A0ABQ9CNL7_9PASS|nr:hypothetical protein WISP_134969 [Willisornis vidua]